MESLLEDTITKALYIRMNKCINKLILKSNNMKKNQLWGMLTLGLMLSISIMSYGQLDYKATWVANTGGTKNTFIQMNMIGATVNQAGITAGVCYWDEGGRGLGIYNTEGKVANPGWNNRNGGTNVGINLNYVYNAGTSSITKRSITNSSVSMKVAIISEISANFTNGDYAYSLKPAAADKLRRMMGITGVSANEFYVVAAVYQLNKVFVYDTNLNLLRTISVDRAYYATPDNSGNVWVVQGADNNNAPKILEFNNTGNPTGKVISGLSDPRSLQISKKGQLIVGDNGTNQQVYFYDITGAPSLVETFGQKGGISSGIPGQVKPDKFSGIVFAGTDSLDNLYVITDLEGSIIRRFDKDRNLLWQKYGLAFVDMADADPNNENDIYSSEERYSMDYSKDNGQEQTLMACTFDPYKYPEDARINTALDGGVWIRWINGKKFMFVGQMYSSFIFIYRFNEATDGEIAIPCGSIMNHWRFGLDGGWPMNQPKVGSFIWRDKNGNGKSEADECETVPYEIALGNVDDVGNIYLDGRMNYFECQGLDEIGNPIYSFKKIVSPSIPKPFINTKKVIYDSKKDAMYITGDTANLSNSWSVGPVFAVYQNWSKGNRTAAWAKSYNMEYNGFAAKGDYFFVAYAMDDASWSVDVFSSKDGSKVGNMIPTGLGQLGWIDIPWGLNVEQRANGEYIVFREDDLLAKTVIFRWNPYEKDNDFPTKPAALNTVSKTSNSVTVSYSKATDVTGLSGYFIYENGVKSNVKTVGDTIYTITGLDPATSYQIYVSAADFAGHETKSDIITVETFPVDDSAPLKPSGFKASNETISTINLIWNSAIDNVGVSGYDLFLNNTKIGYKPINDTVYVITDLKPSTNYEIKLVAYDFAGHTSDTTSIMASTTADTEPPSTPILYSTTQHSSSEIAINWKTSTDNSDVAYYDLYNKGVLIKGKIPAHEYMGIPVNGDYMLYKVTGLDANTSYEFSLKAVDIVGNESGLSNKLTLKTDSVWSRLLDVEEAKMGIGYVFYYGSNIDLSGFLFGSMMPGYMEWTVDVPKDTTYRFVSHFTTEESFVYPMQIDVNGVKMAEFQLYRLPNMTWFGYEDDPSYVIVRLKAGKNLIRLTSYAQYAPNLDLVKIIVHAPFVDVSSLMLDKRSINLEKGDSVQLNATIEPMDATDKRLIWTSSRKATAKVDGNGLVTAVANGTSIIAVTSEDGTKSDTCIVTVGANGIDIMKIDDQIKIYPNPAKDGFFVKLDEIEGSASVDVRLYNSLSTMVMNIKSNNQANGDIMKFDTSTLPNGVYFLQVVMGNKVDTKKVVISK